MIVMRIATDEVQLMCHTIALMRKIVILASLVTVFALSAAAQVSEGDQHWNARAEGHQGGHAKPAQIEAAIAAYQKAVVQEPNNLEARWKLLRAIRFKGAYVAAAGEEKKRVYAFGKKEGDAAIAIVNRDLAAKRVKADAHEKQIAEAARTINGAGEVFFWDSVNWGEWALAYGKMAAVREGAADRIRREATIAMLCDPKMDGGGPQRRRDPARPVPHRLGIELRSGALPEGVVQDRSDEQDHSRLSGGRHGLERQQERSRGHAHPARSHQHAERSQLRGRARTGAGGCEGAAA